MTAVQKRVAEKTLAGDLDGADAEAEDAFAQWERDEAERAEAAQRSGVALIETAIETALARGDAEAVARREMRKIALTVPEDGRYDAARSLRHDYYYRGERMGTRIDLRIAAALAYAYGKTENREHWAMAKNDLGNVLQVLGSRGEEGALQEAVAAYRAALEVHTREAAPMHWAMTQNKIGKALPELGNIEADDGLYEVAIDAHSSALAVYTPEATPMQWAKTQMSLALTLEALAEMSNDLKRRELLEEALKRLTAALDVLKELNARFQVRQATEIQVRIIAKLSQSEDELNLDAEKEVLEQRPAPHTYTYNDGEIDTASDTSAHDAIGEAIYDDVKEKAEKAKAAAGANTGEARLEATLDRFFEMLGDDLSED